MEDSIQRYADDKIPEAGFDRTRSAIVLKIFQNRNTCDILIDGSTFYDVPVYGDAGSLKEKQGCIVLYPCNQTSQMKILGKSGTPEGVTIASTTVEYYLSTSPTEPVGGSWSTSPPTWTVGTYIWTRLLITYSDGNTYTTVPWNSNPNVIVEQWDEPDANTFSTDRKVVIRNTAGDIYPLDMYGGNDARFRIYLTTDSVRFTQTNVSGYTFNQRIYPQGTTGTLDFGLTGARWRDGYFSRNVYANDFFLNGTSLTTTLSTKADLGSDGKVLPEQLPDTDSYWELQSDNTILRTTYRIRADQGAHFYGSTYNYSGSYHYFYNAENTGFAYFQAGSGSMFVRMNGLNNFYFQTSLLPLTDLTYNLGHPNYKWNIVYGNTLRAETLNINGTDIDFDALANQKQWDEPNTTTLSTTKDVKINSGKLWVGNTTGAINDQYYQLRLHNVQESAFGLQLGIDTVGTVRLYPTTSTGTNLMYFNMSLLPATNGQYNLGSNTARWNFVYTNDIYLNGNSLSATLNNKADLINGKVPNSQLPDDLVSGQWDEPDIDTLATDKIVEINNQLIINNSRQGVQTTFNQTEDGLFVGGSTPMILSGKNLIITGGGILGDNGQEVSEGWFRSLNINGTTTTQNVLPDETRYRNIGSFQYEYYNGYFYGTVYAGDLSVREDFEYQGQSFENILAKKADLVNGKVPESQLPDSVTNYWQIEGAGSTRTISPIAANAVRNLNIDGTLQSGLTNDAYMRMYYSSGYGLLQSSSGEIRVMGSYFNPFSTAQRLGSPTQQWMSVYVSDDFYINNVSINDRITALENASDEDSYWELSGSTLIAKKPDGGVVGIDVNNSSYFRAGAYVTNSSYLSFYYAADSSGGYGNIQADATSLRFGRSGNIVDFKFVGPVRPGVDSSYNLGEPNYQWDGGYFKTLTASGNIRSSGQIAVFSNPSSTANYLELSSSSASYAIIRTDNRGIELRGVTYFGPYAANFTSLGQTNYRFVDGFFSGDIYIGASNTTNGVDARLTSLESSVGYAKLTVDTMLTSQDTFSFTMAENKLPTGVNVQMNNDGELVITKPNGRVMSYHITGMVDWRLQVLNEDTPDPDNYFIGFVTGGDAEVPFSVSETGRNYWSAIPLECTGTIIAASTARFIPLQVNLHKMGPKGLIGGPYGGSITVEVRLQ